MVQWLRPCHPIQEIQVLSLVLELTSYMPHSQKQKANLKNNIVTNSIKTLKMVLIKKKKSLHIVIVGEDMKKRLPLYTVSGKLNWCNCYGKQNEASLKNST